MKLCTAETTTIDADIIKPYRRTAVDFDETDFRGWRQIFGVKKQYFTLNNYKRYLKEVKRLATKLGWLPQEVDLAIWEYDRQKSGIER